MKRHYIYIVMGAMLATTACSDDYFNKDEDHEYSDYIGFNINVTGDQFQSRATGTTPSHGSRRLTIDATEASIGGRPLYLHTEVVDSIPQAITRAKNGDSATPSRGTITTNPEDIGISAVVFDGEKNAWPADDNSLSAQMYMHNEKLTSPWQTNRYWPRENDWIRFYAYSPYGILGDDGLPAISTTEPSFSYTVNNDITKQQDLLVGSEQYLGGWCRTAPLDMSHALTAVRIHIAGSVDKFTLNSVTISGLKNHGTYTFKYNPENYSVDTNGNKTETHDEGTWSEATYNGTDDASSASYTVFQKEEGCALTGEGGKDVNGSDNVKLFENEDVTTYVDATPGNMVLLLMPQELTADAKITITGRDDVLNKDGVTLTATIGAADKSKKWEKGKMYTYTLSFSSTKIEYHLEVNPEKTTIEYYGIKDSPYTVKSYKVVTSATGEKTSEVAWILDETAENGYPVNTWFDLTGRSGEGSVTGESYTYSAVAGPSSVSHNNLANTSVKNDWFDLSREETYSASNKPNNTANCYLVLSPGYYTFPLVYGNAITNGEDNTNAYSTSASNYSQFQYIQDSNGNMLKSNGSGGIATSDNKEVTTINESEAIKVTTTVTKLEYFKDHADANISSPWIVSSNSRGGKYVAAKADIVWQDEPCLITEVDLNATKDYITFRVREDCICEGNAVIAVKNAAGDIMWSWHIWVTDQKSYYDNGAGSFEFSISDGMTRTVDSRRLKSTWKDNGTSIGENTGTFTESSFQLMRVCIGHCDGETKTYDQRTQKLRFRQVDPDAKNADDLKTVEITITQNGKELSTVDNVPYYQYGRKDPLMPTMTGSGTNKIHYKSDMQPTGEVESKAEQATLGGAIKNPDVIYHDGSRSDGFLQINNWCSSGNYVNLWNSTSYLLPMFAYHSQISAGDFHPKFDELVSYGVVKTVYDPCPPGYELPRIDAFYGAVYDGINFHPFYYTDNVDGLNGKEDFAYVSKDDYVNGNQMHKYTNLIAPGGSESGFTDYNGVTQKGGLMTTKGTVGGGDYLFHQFLGHRNSAGNVEKYGDYCNALTSTPICLQWTKQNASTRKYEWHLARLCIIKSSYSLRVTSSSDFDLAFPIMPARTGCNPSTTVIDTNIGWTGDDDHSSESDVEF